MEKSPHEETRSTRSRDELNLAEFPLSLIGRRAPGSAKTIRFEDRTWDRSVGDYVTRRLTVTASDLLGLPTATDDEVLVGCMKLTKDQGFESPRVLFTSYAFLELLGWPRDGRSYRRLSQSLDRWAGTLVISDNAFWHKGRQKWVKDTINIVDRVHFYRGGEGDPEHGARSWFVWGDFMWESFRAGNLRSLDFEFWKSLDRPVSKRLFRLLQKKFYYRRRVAFPLRTLAFEKVGLSRNMHTGQIKAKLKPGHDELRARGFCRSEYVTRGRGDWEVVYTDLRRETPPAVATAASPLVAELEKRGIKNAAELVDRASAKRIEEAVENYDDRRRAGEQLGPGWLGKCITHKTPFAFRKGYRSRAERAAAEAESERRRADRRRAEAEERRAARKRREEFKAFLASLPDDDARDAFARRALAANRLLREFYNERLAAGDDDAARKRRHEAMFLLWEAEGRPAAGVRSQPNGPRSAS